MSFVTGVLHPEGFHGHGVTSSYFEGWYVKVVSADRSARWAVIPGVFLGPDGGGEAFVQVLDGATGESWYHRYDLADFGAEAERFSVKVGPNRFSDRGVVLDLPSLQGRGAFETPLDPWPVSLALPRCHGVVRLGAQDGVQARRRLLRARPGRSADPRRGDRPRSTGDAAIWRRTGAQPSPPATSGCRPTTSASPAPACRLDRAHPVAALGVPRAHRRVKHRGELHTSRRTPAP